MADQALDTVVFDLGDVLFAWDPRRIFRPRFRSKPELEAFMAEVFMPWNDSTNEGHSEDEAFARLDGAAPAHREHIDEYSKRFAETLRPIEGSIALLEEVRAAGHRLLALTNWSAELFPVASTNFECMQAFEGVVVSGEEGARKPDPALYHVLFDRYDVDPRGAAYIDDRPENVATASELGMTALHFTGPDMLRRDLVRLGLLPG